MRLLRIKFTISRIMTVIAVFAIALAVLPGGLVIFGSIILLTLVGLIVVGSTVTGAPWTQVAAWVFAAYPAGLLTSIYATWLTAWLSLGHRPQPSRDDPESINTLVSLIRAFTFWLFIFYFPALFLCVGFVIAEAVRVTSGGRHRLGMVGILAGVAILIWSAWFLVINADPGRVIDWFGD